MRPPVIIGINDLVVGGAQRLVINQLAHADRQKGAWHLVTLFEFPERQDFYDRVPPDVTVHRIGMRGAYDLRGWVRLLRVLWRVRPARVISHLFFANLVFRLCSFAFGYRVFTVEHNTYANKRRWQVWADRFLAPLSAKVIAVSEEVRAFTIRQQRLPPGKCVCIENGIDLGFLHRYAKEHSVASVRADLGIGETDTCLLNVARLTPQKNHRLLLNGLAAFLAELPTERRPFFKLLIAGEGVLYDEMEALLRELKIDQHVRLLGGIRDVRPFYRAADVFLSTSIIEGMSIAYLEALAFGLPLVATRTGGTGVLLEDGMNGFFINEAQPSAVAAALRRWLDADQDALRQRARAIADVYDIRKNVEAYERLICGAV